MTPAKRLIRLPNGDWIDPQRIDVVKVFGAATCLGNLTPNRVVVGAGNQLIIIHCESYDDAAELADRIAEAANGGDWEP